MNTSIRLSARCLYNEATIPRFEVLVAYRFSALELKPSKVLVAVDERRVLSRRRDHNVRLFTPLSLSFLRHRHGRHVDFLWPALPPAPSTAFAPAPAPAPATAAAKPAAAAAAAARAAAVVAAAAAAA
ncbi:hypothetical protein EKO27_g2106 [Xylaria grammica]|uniref:Uncharacterized protein n=1 Tax=Xylaria grammica TaxID=363999 RepID=A0A439DEZ7_9PEZI|nr:hypothetical protein EKO27_g2106 [Xylaria grammica]